MRDCARTHTPSRIISTARHRLLSPFNYPLKSVGDPGEAITICGSRGGCCHGPIFIGGAFQIGDCEFGEKSAMIIGHRDTWPFNGEWTEGGRERASLSTTRTLAKTGDGKLVIGTDVGHVQPLMITVD